MSLSHLIVTPVVMPAVLGAFIVLVARHDLLLSRVLSIFGSAALLVVSVLLLTAITASGPETYALGDWPAPFGIVLVADRMAAMMLTLAAALALVVQVYAVGSGWDARGQHFHALWQFQLMGICGAFLTGDAFNLFVFFEVLLIASYGLMIHAGGKARLKAGVQYIAYNLIGSTLFLFGLATLYSVTGTLNIADLAAKLPTLPEGDAALIRVTAVMLMMVFAIKGALVPLHFWLPATYAQAPGPVSALFAVMTKIGAYAAIRFSTLMFPASVPAIGTLLQDLMFWAAIATLVVGAAGVLGAVTLNRLAAFAAVTSMGTLFLAASGGTAPDTAAALYYALHSTLAAGAMFLIADLVTTGRGTGDLRRAMAPIAQQGLIAALFMVAAVAAAGLPPLPGFFGKLMILQASEGALSWAAILGSSLVVIVGMARAGSLLFWSSHAVAPAADDFDTPRKPWAIAAALMLLAGMATLTVASGPVTAWLAETAAELHDPAAYIAANNLPEG